jgi:hypothetical protein
MNWSYIAGFFDGEGCATARRRDGHFENLLQTSNTDRTALERCQEFAVMGVVRKQGGEKKHPNNKQAWTWRIGHRKDVLRFIENVKEYVIVKRAALLQMEKDILEHNYHRAPLKLRDVDPEEIRRLYWKVTKPIHEIAETYSVTTGAMFEFMVKNEIPRRSRSEARKAWMSA